MRHWSVLFAAMMWVTAAGAVNVGGAILPDSARLTTDGPELVLNGAGERRMLLFRIYAIGLYLPARRQTTNDVLALRGPKRLLLVTLRNEITARQVHEHVIDRIEDGTQPEEMAVMKARLDELDKIIQSEHAIYRGGTISLDYIPDKGTVIRINGIVHGDPIPGEDFYNALLRLWLGERARSASLRDALLGRS